MTIPASNDFTVLQDELIGAALPQRQSEQEKQQQEQYVETAVYCRSVMRLSNIDFVYVFERPLLDLETLKASLARVLCDYPTLAGRMCGNRDSKVHLNNHGARLVVQQQPSGSSAVSSISDIPDEPATGPPYCTIPRPVDQVKGRAPLLTVTVTNFVDGCTLGVVMNHVIADGWTFAMFMKDWSATLQEMISEGKNEENSRILESVRVHLPEVLFETFPTRRDIDEAAKALGRKQSPWIKRTLLKWFMRYIVPAMMRSKDPRIGRTPNRLVIRYSAKQVKDIKSRAQAVAGTWMSTNEAVLAHVWRVLLDAAGLTPEQRSRVGFAIVVNLRGKLPGVVHRLAGNVVSGTEAPLDMKENPQHKTQPKNQEDEDDSSIERRIHDAMRDCLRFDNLTSVLRIQNDLWSENNSDFYSFYESDHVGDINFGGIPGCLQWNWHATNPYYEVDFGTGRPLRGIPWDWKQNVTILPSPRDEGGVDVYVDKTERGPVAWKQPTSTAAEESTVSKANDKPTRFITYNILGGMVVGVVACGTTVVLSAVGGGSPSAGGSGCLLRLGSSWSLLSLAAAAATAALYSGTSMYARRQRQIERSKREFHEYVLANAHRNIASS